MFLGFLHNLVSGIEHDVVEMDPVFEKHMLFAVL
jgi:hypothetical protein